jgi:Methyltransferase domain
MSTEEMRVLTPEKIDHAKRLTEAGISIQDVERTLFGRRSDSFDVDKIAWLAAGVTASDYVGANMRTARRFRNKGEMLTEGVNIATVQGLVAEFGVYSGKTIRHIAKQCPDQHVYGFDGFEGIPEDWKPGSKKGAYSSNKVLPEVPQSVKLVVGWFEDTLPAFIEEHKGEVFRYIHVDCDVYSSTRTIFTLCKHMIVPGTVLQFDEYYNYPHWQQHEFKAFQELITATGLSYKYIGLISHHQQVLVQIV